MRSATPLVNCRAILAAPKIPMRRGLGGDSMIDTFRQTVCLWFGQPGGADLLGPLSRSLRHHVKFVVIFFKFERSAQQYLVVVRTDCP